ncbi:hypothetical protein LB523_11975 [Mesorhizobium sp. ESP-6-4]|uniref:hypothetical protein n=1 Tax=Mesorhizobium sp. ESP-6-4 TaxID=2876624 RepID=UPI001CCD566E|nr:hypothetical protein [Mesorhizobium sp. ESP-6-4]MBZ9659763.1 hypothetical protein [Mesorhizobium sp. ESP-6-4]
MTLRYVRSGAGGAATGVDWANAYLTLAAALTASAAGDTIYVSEDHAETQATAMTLTSPGSAASPVQVICVNHSGSVPPVSADLRTTATVSTTGASLIRFTGADTVTEYEGIAFSAGSGSSVANLHLSDNSSRATLKFKNCALKLNTTSTSVNINCGFNNQNGVFIVLENTTMQFGSTSQGCVIAATVFWRDTASALAGATFPSTLFKGLASGNGSLDLSGVDLSALAGTIFGAVSSETGQRYVMRDCKINASATISATPTARGSSFVDYIRADSGGTNYKQGRYRYEGSTVQETTIVRTGGATDGTTPLSWKIVTTANSSRHFPYESAVIAIWNDTTGASVTATIEGIWGGGAVPNNDDIWIAVEYLGSSSSPQSSFARTSPADTLAAGGAIASSTATWGGSTTAFKMAATFTPQQKGWIFVIVKAAKASSTFYIDPKITLS